MKAFLFLSLGILFSFSPVFSQLFFDGFEEEINPNATFQNWTTENLAGWNYWHIVDYGNQHMRFEKTGIPQEDWLISKAIDCSGFNSLEISFGLLYEGDGNQPELVYTSNYTGNSATSSWTSIPYSLCASENEWCNISGLIIDSPGSTVCFAFHYTSTPESELFILIDDFRVNAKITLSTEELVGSSENFNFYSLNGDQTNFYEEIEQDLERAFLNYQSLWVRPGFAPIFPADHKISVILTDRMVLKQLNPDLPDWDCGLFDRSSGEIYLAPLATEDQQNYYHDFSSLAVNELAQLALAGWSGNTPERYFSEGFALYEMGYRPDRDKLLSKLNELGTNEPTEEVIKDITRLHENGNKDLLCSFIESKVLLHCYWYIYNTDAYLWHQLLKHYYIKEEGRITQLYSTDHFDVYAAAKEQPYVAALAANMEDQLAIQEGRFEQEMHHRVNICIYDVEVGKEINNRTDFQGLACGADKINATHQEEGHYGLLNHEFMHCWVNILSNNNPYPGQFLNEGLAESTDAFMSDEEMPWHRYKIDDLFYHYQRKYNREPTWLEIVDNAEVNKDDGFWVDAYALGEMYWRYMNDKYPDNFWLNVKRFLQNGRDWTIFNGKSAEQEGAEFIQFMKELASVGPPVETTSIPFQEDFKNEFTGWTRMRFGGNDPWQIQDNFGYEDNYCAYAVDPYWFGEEEDKTIDSWLVSPPLDAAESDSLLVEFMYVQHGSSNKPEIYYTGDFSGPTVPVNWIAVDDLNWNSPEGTWGKLEFKIKNPPQKLFIGLRFHSEEGDLYTYCIDNFKVTNEFSVPTKPLVELPFSDDFSNNYQNWTTASVTGDDVWHISNDDGIDFGKCARFYKISNPGQQNDDWLISPVFNTTGISNLAITFKYSYAFEGAAPDFYYASTFDGDPANSAWTKIDKDFWTYAGGWQVARIEFADPGESFVFAVRYVLMPEDEYYFLMDDFNVKSDVPKPEHQLAGSSTHFNYFTNMPESLNYFLEIQNGLEAEFIQLNSNWNRPGQEKVFEDNAKIDVYYSTKEHQAGLEEYVDSWRCGFYLADGSTLYLTPLLTNEQFSYYKNLGGEAVHTFSKMALRRRMARDAGQMTSLPAYFGEGFGLYEIGYRPRRDSIIAYLNQHPGALDHNSISDITDITSTSKKDIVVSYVEGQILLPLGYRHCHHNYGSYPPIWNNYLHYFYTVNDVERIVLNGQSENFDVYCSSRDIEYVDSMLVWLERTRDFYVNDYEMEFNNPFHMCVLYDEKTGMDLTGYDEFNGGAGSLNISPDHNPDGLEGYPWLLAHEFGHVFNDYMYYDFPFGFYHEGMANFSGYQLYGVDWMESKWQIKAVFDYYQDQYGRYPKLEEFETDPDQKIDPYFFGLQFIRYLASFSSLPEIRAFFNAGLDFSVLGKTRSGIESGYINYLKGLNGTGNSWTTSKPYVLSLVSNKLFIEASNRETLLSISLFDLRGRRIQYQALAGYEHNTIDLPLSEGVFVIQLVSDKAVYVEKIALHPTMSR